MSNQSFQVSILKLFLQYGPFRAGNPPERTEQSDENRCQETPDRKKEQSDWPHGQEKKHRDKKRQHLIGNTFTHATSFKQGGYFHLQHFREHLIDPFTTLYRSLYQFAQLFCCSCRLNYNRPGNYHTSSILQL